MDARREQDSTAVRTGRSLAAGRRSRRCGPRRAGESDKISVPLLAVAMGDCSRCGAVLIDQAAEAFAAIHACGARGVETMGMMFARSGAARSNPR